MNITKEKTKVGFLFFEMLTFYVWIFIHEWQVWW
jgi:hypothetical protein